MKERIYRKEMNKKTKETLEMFGLGKHMEKKVSISLLLVFDLVKM